MKNVDIDKILSSLSYSLKLVVAKSRSLRTSINPLVSYKDFSVEVLKQLKENQELIIKNANDPFSPELLLLPEYNNWFFHVICNFMSFPCILDDCMFAP